MSTDTSDLSGLNVTGPLAMTDSQQMAWCVVTMVMYLAGKNPQHKDPLISMCADLEDMFQLPKH